MDILLLISLLLFALEVFSKVSLVILAVVAVKALKHLSMWLYGEPKPGRLSSAAKAAWIELFGKR